MPMLPLGAACVGAAVRSAGHETRLLNLMMEPDARALARTAVDEGLITPEDDLLRPRFYIASGLREWLPERVARFETAAA